jgi:hypothetical protein
MNWNWLAILCAGVAYWVLGFVWYSLLFGKIWRAEQERHRGGNPCPPGGMAGKLIGTFICNLLAAGAMEYFLYRAQILDINHALRFGIAAGVGVAGAAVTMCCIWEMKSTKLWFIDAGYNIVGCVLVALILVSWPM